jgi:6,7-dimethyl-8-ribityllumazine synthase
MQAAEQAQFKPFDASGWQVGIVVAQFNKQITEQQYKSALDKAKAYSLKSSDIRTIRVAGAMEIPVALLHLAQSGKYRALLAIGCVIKGETPHFEYVCRLVTEGILRVELDQHIPVGFGILTCNTLDQAVSRANLGGDHLVAALQLAKSIEE